jgi:hypothetical protein
MQLVARSRIARPEDLDKDEEDEFQPTAKV